MKTIAKITALMASVVVAAPAFAATQATLKLTGSVPASTYISIASTNVETGAVEQAYTIDSAKLTTAGSNTVDNIAYVFETSNRKAGYTVTASSAHNGKLTMDDSNASDAAAINYALIYNGQEKSLSSSQTVTDVSSLTQKTTATKSVGLKITGNANALEGTYKDTVTFTITAK
ncbi:hypothetical protein ACLSU7_10965 [Bdellovibrio sp. HCB185ZH]|uniref:hypothetical protein n=1 Tax=Bdellovibrio sp. HCB185ZH TaxID=3394235 RepID=UPI0039A5D06A